MVKIKAMITTEVVRYIDEDINNSREVKRKLLDRLAIEGYVNSNIEYMTTTREDPPDPTDEDSEYYLDPDYCQGFMYGKLP